MSLELVHILRKHPNCPLADRFSAVLRQLWERFQKIREILFEYYDEWLEIRSDIKGWKARQRRREEEEERNEEQEN